MTSKVPAPDPSANDPIALAYAQGDFARARKLVLAELANASANAERDAKLETAARAWLRRLSVDVSVYIVLGFALLLFCAIVLRYGVD